MSPPGARACCHARSPQPWAPGQSLTEDRCTSLRAGHERHDVSRCTPLHVDAPATRKRSDGFPKPASRSRRLSCWFSSRPSESSSRPWRKTSFGWDPPHEQLQDFSSP
jgi:hypothetical protein